ncbi:MAG: cytochrome c3 family protein, partial [Pyrinomonadaceae bacterium]
IQLNHARRWVLAALVLICSLLIVVVAERVSAVTTAAKSRRVESSAPVADYAKFSHSTPREHAELMSRSNCASCHRRNDGSLAPRFPLHKDCTGCHLVQFTASNSTSAVNPICTICHSKDGLNSSNPPTKSFPALLSFRAEFDHAQHLQEKETAKPSAGCAACHNPAGRGVAESIPARLNAHQVCYECHSSGKQANDLSSCGVCHALGSYSPTSTNARAYRVSFSHADHAARARLTCTSCHNVRARGLPQPRQVSSTLPVQHFANSLAQSCLTCHNGRRAFGDTETHDCKRCHRREGFRMSE